MGGEIRVKIVENRQKSQNIDKKSTKSQKLRVEIDIILIDNVLTPPNRVSIGSFFFPDQARSFSIKLEKKGGR